MPQGLDHVAFVKDAHLVVNLTVQPEFLVDLVSANAA